MFGGFDVAVYGLSLGVARFVFLWLCWLWVVCLIAMVFVAARCVVCFCGLLLSGCVYLVYIVDFVDLHIVGAWYGWWLVWWLLSVLICG